ncbi:hypothetical protein McpSp1_14070 [Methanocorpusculaceae archaeon Sp1]|nr:hypothetical protein [Methanocorpusculaceae archaeon Sp1]
MKIFPRQFFSENFRNETNEIFCEITTIHFRVVHVCSVMFFREISVCSVCSVGGAVSTTERKKNENDQAFLIVMIASSTMITSTAMPETE